MPDFLPAPSAGGGQFMKVHKRERRVDLLTVEQLSNRGVAGFPLRHSGKVVRVEVEYRSLNEIPHHLVPPKPLRDQFHELPPPRDQSHDGTKASDYGHNPCEHVVGLALSKLFHPRAWKYPH